MKKSALVLLAAYPQSTVFDGEDGGDGDAGGGEGGAGDAPKTFTQDEMNKILAADKRKNSAQSDKYKKQATDSLAELQRLKESTTLSGDEKEEMEQRIEILSNELLTKEELASKQSKKNADKHGKELASVTGERDHWKNQFTNTSIQRAIMDAAVASDAYNPSQVVELLDRKASLVETLDEDGKPTGQFGVKIKFADVDKDDNPVTLDLSPKDTVKRMKEIEGYQNLFKGKGTGGLGGTNKGSGKDLDMKKLAKNPVAYRKWRKENNLT